MDGVKMAMGSRGMTLEAARPCTKDRKDWRTLVHRYMVGFNAPFLHGRAFFSDRLVADYHQEWSGMPLHNSVGVNCEKCT